MSARYNTGATSNIIQTLIQQKGDEKINDSTLVDENISPAFAVLQVVQNRDTRRETNKKILRSVKRKLGAKDEIIWMKTNVSPETSKRVLDDNRYVGSWSQRKVDEVDDVKSSCGILFGCKPDEEPSKFSIGSLLDRLRLIGALYLDLTKAGVG